MSGLYCVQNRELEPVAPVITQITQYDYDLLTTEEKMDETRFYCITDYYSELVLEKQIPVKMLPKTCDKCGAPLVSHRCEYCGTEYQ